MKKVARFSKLTPRTYDEIFSSGRRYATPLAVALFQGCVGNGALGVVASSKIGSAVNRNRAKRLLREYAKSRKHLLFGKNVVLIARRALVKQTLQELSRTMDLVVADEFIQ